MKNYKFECGGMVIYYRGNNLGEAIQQFLKHRPSYILLIESITEEPSK